MTISVVTDSGKEDLVWGAGLTEGWTQGQVRVKATESIFTAVAYQVRRALYYIVITLSECSLTVLFIVA